MLIWVTHFISRLHLLTEMDWRSHSCTPMFNLYVQKKHRSRSFLFPACDCIVNSQQDLNVMLWDKTRDSMAEWGMTVIQFIYLYELYTGGLRNPEIVVLSCSFTLIKTRLCSTTVFEDDPFKLEKTTTKQTWFGCKWAAPVSSVWSRMDLGKGVFNCPRGSTRDLRSCRLN